MQQQMTAIQKLVNTAIEFLVNYSFQVLGAVIVLVLAGLIGRWVGKLLMGVCEKKKMDIALSRLLVSFVKIIIFVFAAIIALGKFGITITPFIAALGAMAFGATYAIQGPLSNYCAGMTIILGRAFSVGDTITVKEVSGVVEDIKLPSTILVNEDGVKISIPNKQIVGEIIQNSGKNCVVEAAVGVSYDDNPEKAIIIIRDLLSRFKEVTVNPAPQVGIQKFGDSSIDIAFRYWVPTTRYFHTAHAVNLAVYKALKDANITIPFPQREIKILSGAAKP